MMATPTALSIRTGLRPVHTVPSSISTKCTTNQLSPMAAACRPEEETWLAASTQAADSPQGCAFAEKDTEGVDYILADDAYRVSLIHCIRAGLFVRSAHRPQ